MLDPLFVAAVLEGFEGTLDEVVGRVDCPELRADLDVLQSQVTALRVSIEKPQTGNRSAAQHRRRRLPQNS
jgi:hypothetical protein